MVWDYFSKAPFVFPPIFFTSILSAVLISDFLTCNYLDKVWRHVENFPHVVFFATSRGKFFYLAREIIFAILAFFCNKTFFVLKNHYKDI